MWRLGAPIAALFLLAGCATTGVIRGSVRMPAPPNRTGPTARQSVERLSAPGARTRDVVVFVDRLPEKAMRRVPKPVARPAVIQAHNQFVPHVLPVVRGTTVRFENRDAVYHNTFSVSPAKRFDLGKYRPGESRSVTFDRLGAVNLFCDLHPGSSGFVLVVPNSAYTQPDARGGFALPPLPRGWYKVKFWHPVLGERSRRVEIPKRGDASVELNF